MTENDFSTREREESTLEKGGQETTRESIGSTVNSVSNEQQTLTDRSPYLVQRLKDTHEVNLFNHVKFHRIKSHIEQLRLTPPRVLDIGCGLQVANRYLKKLSLDFQYFGIDYEPGFFPDAQIDLLNLPEQKLELPWQPNIVLLLDVLEHLHENEQELEKILKGIKRILPSDCTLIITLPQMYRLDRFKLKHLHYPEHKIRLTQQEWIGLIGKHFTVQSVEGFGYLSVIPYLPMASRHYRPDNKLGSLFQYLRAEFFEWKPFKPADLWLSRLLGRLPLFKYFSNDILLVVRPK